MGIIELVLGNEMFTKAGNLKIVFCSGKEYINEKFTLRTDGKEILMVAVETSFAFKRFSLQLQPLLNSVNSGLTELNVFFFFYSEKDTKIF
jgi:hypothetical protein